MENKWIIEQLTKLQRYEPTQNEGGGVDYWVTLEKDDNGEVILWEDIMKIIAKITLEKEVNNEL